jgi:hypothetical protein
VQYRVLRAGKYSSQSSKNDITLRDLLPSPTESRLPLIRALAHDHHPPAVDRPSAQAISLQIIKAAVNNLAQRGLRHSSEDTDRYSIVNALLRLLLVPCAWFGFGRIQNCETDRLTVDDQRKGHRRGDDVPYHLSSGAPNITGDRESGSATKAKRLLF